MAQCATIERDGASLQEWTSQLKEATEKTQRGIQSVEVAGRVLDALARRREPAALSELAAAAELSTAQAHTYLVSLTKLGLVKRDALTGYYEPGPLSLRLGMMDVEQQPAYRIAAPHATQLAQRIGFSVAVCVAGAQGPTIVRYERGGYPLHVNLHVGTVMSLRTTATGRVFSAFLRAAELAAMMERQGLTPPHVGAEEASLDPNEPAQWQAGVDDARRRGIARSVDVPSPGISSMSVPVLDAQRELLLALTVIGPSGTMDVGWNGAIARELREVAQHIAQALPHRSPTHAS
ncbi:IclR family transcriptional regulator [Paraburkholderia sp. G-4-1-8]|uniref:IclR family transcriptional regulator n=1 Tax=Paraburkholderia antibiotica TaxID=2728839 RepID=A0A7X9ZXV7_9BURK|nr:IclR family transcriptional regulator [Paraburkholderia antibiotica]